MKAYDSRARALDGVDLELGPGVFGLLGPNGAGKSTLISILAGAMDFEAGDVRLGGSLHPLRTPRAWRRRLGYTPQRFDFPPHLTAREFLAQSALMAGLSPFGLRRRIDAALDSVRLLADGKRNAADFSRGMKQRLAVAASLIAKPDLLLLDEPTAGLDPSERVLFREVLAEAGSRCIVVLSTHIVSDVETCCESMAILAKGRIEFHGPPAELIRRVEGRVWEADEEGTRVGERTDAPVMVAMRMKDGRARARFVGEAPPAPGAERVEANLEDAYVHFLAQLGVEAEARA